jgi:RecB family exonuclease
VRSRSLDKEKMNRRFSASQIGLYRQCPRKWWFKYVLRIPEPSRPWFKFGRDFAEEMENYLKGRLPAEKLSPLAAAGLTVLPPPMPAGNILVEKEIHFDLGEKSDEKLPFIGYIDLVDLAPDPIEVLDHKTPKSLRWAKTETQLRTNEQLMLYAHWTLGQYDLSRVVVGHLSFPKESLKQGNPRVVKTAVEVSADHVAEQIDTIRSEAREMKMLALETDRVSIIPANHGNACFAFGGCPYRGMCPKVQARPPLPANASAHEVADSLFASFEDVKSAPCSQPTEDNMSRLNRLLNGNAPVPEPEAPAPSEGLLPPDAPPTQASAPQVDEDSLSDTVEALAEQLEQDEVESAEVPALDENENENEDAAAKWGMPITEIAGLPTRALKRFTERGWTHESDIIELDYSALSEIQGLGEKSISKTMAVLDRLRKLRSIKATQGESEQSEAAPARTEKEESAFARYRRLRAEGAIAAPGERPETTPEPVVPPPMATRPAATFVPYKEMESTAPSEQQASKPAPPKAPAPVIRDAPVTEQSEQPTPAASLTVLYIGCMPTKGVSGKVDFLEDLLAPLQQTVADSEGKLHYSLIDYGKGAPLVVQQMVLNLDLFRGKQIVVGSPYSKMSRAALELLRPVADVVIQGVEG